ncbi:LCP family protein [Candidatus Peregrinibacteria bacterium]|nr:LCP family protein [Candidatus Peregrinibacteria bacterium]MBT4055865.1 LCP family protein [Candidatus Peregrinibacteria bacterium]
MSRKRKHTINISIIASVIIVILLCTAIVKAIASIDFNAILLSAGADLEEDAGNRTNFLLLGTGGGEHDGADLTDTIILVSLNRDNGTISLVSIPRDLHIENPELQSARINEIYFYAKEKFGDSEEGLEYLLEKVEEFSGIEIPYYIKIDFDGFTEIIDALGGIDIYVEEKLYDPFYPREGTIGFELFSLSKGRHHLDGETALKYARSRKTTSDFDRSKRQQDILYAIKEKALQTKTILSKSKLTNLLDTVKKNFETNLSVREFLTLGALAEDFNKDSITNRVLHDDPVYCGGFLYTPLVLTESYDGAFVLIPAGKISTVQKYFEIATTHPEALEENLKVQILNGTTKSGSAAETKQVLQRYCLNITRFGNAANQEVTQTKIYYKPTPLPKETPDSKIEYAEPKTLELIKALIPTAETSTEFPQNYIDLGYKKTSDIIIELGSDYTHSDDFLVDEFYSLYEEIYAEPEEETEEGAETSTETPAETTTE